MSDTVRAAMHAFFFSLQSYSQTCGRISWGKSLSPACFSATSWTSRGDGLWPLDEPGTPSPRPPEKKTDVIINTFNFVRWQFEDKRKNIRSRFVFYLQETVPRGNVLFLFEKESVSSSHEEFYLSVSSKWILSIWSEISVQTPLRSGLSVHVSVWVFLRILSFIPTSQKCNPGRWISCAKWGAMMM